MTANPLTPGVAIRTHWPEYLMEAWGLGTFMVSAAVFTTLIEYPGSPVRQAIASAEIRRLLIGLAMGLTAIAIIYSPWGRQSGAHINPAVTLTFLRLGKIARSDALFYILAQFAGGALGVLIGWLLLGHAFADPPVDFVNTRPGAGGAGPAWLAEAAMGFGIMTIVLAALASQRLMPFIGVFAGLCVATYIALLAPLSGMSINPARTLASALPEALWDHLWIYFTAPPAGMLLAVEVRRLLRHGRERFCAKLNHHPAYRCIHCGYRPARTPRGAPGAQPGRPHRPAACTEEE